MTTTEFADGVERSIGTREGVRVQSVARVYPTGLDDLWDACTNAERLPRWFLPVTGELRLGGHYQLEGNAGGTVQECDPPHTFTVTWEFAGGVSHVTVRLTAVDGERTRFALEHVGDVPHEFWTQYGPGATGVGWDGALLGLHLHVTDPTAAKPAEDDPAMHPFLIASARAWQAVAEADGQTPDDARAAADRTIEFYTGAPAPS